MGTFARWLLDEEQKELFNVLYAFALNAVFLALAALALWPLGGASLSLRLAKGFWVFWVVITETAVVLVLFQRIFRIDLDTHFDAYVISALVLSGFLQAGWSAFVATTVEDFVAGRSFWSAAPFHVVGFLSAYVAVAIVSAFYEGSIYKSVNLPLALLSFVVFSVWPGAGRAVYGWFFNLF